MTYQTIKVRFHEAICFIQLYRPEADNTINDQLLEELHQVLEQCTRQRDTPITIIVLEGLPEVFCSGADFQSLSPQSTEKQLPPVAPEPLYDFWASLACGPYISIAHVRGKVNAGGIGFASACDIVLADHSAQFSLSELLFGLFPACVLPFLIRRVGFQKAHYLTLMTQPIAAEQALAIGLVDAYDTQSDLLLRKHLLRLRHISKQAVTHYKNYMNEMNALIQQSKTVALTANRSMFADAAILKGIDSYVREGKFPWES